MKYPEKYKGKKIIIFYSYQDADGREVFVVGRTEDKEFPIFYENEYRHAKWGSPPINVPYRLPELLKAPADAKIFIVEGEKDVESLRKLGLVATTSRGGSAAHGNYRLWLEYFGERSIVILPDNDPPGEKYGQAVLDILGPVAKAITLIRLPDLEPKEDVTDWLERRGGDLDQLNALVMRSFEPDVPRILQGDGQAELPTEHGDAWEGDVVAQEERFEYGRDWVPFPVHALPMEIRDYAVEMARVLSSDPGYCVLPCLIAIGGAIGNSRICQITEEWTEPSVFWGCLIADPSSLKTPAYLKAREPIEALEEEFAEQYEKATEEYEAEWELWKKSSKRGVDGQAENDAGPSPKKPPSHRIKVDDITVERLAEILFDNPKGVILFKDELAGWFGSFARYKQGGIGGTDEPFWLEVFRANTRNVDRKGGHKSSIRIKRAACSVYGATQPEIAANVFQQSFFSSGFIARILFAMPPIRQKVFIKEPIPLIVREAYHRTFRELYYMDGPAVLERKHPPQFVGFTADGMTAWEHFYAEWGKRQFQAFGEYGSALAKLEAYCARFAMMFSLVDYKNGRQPHEQITGDHVCRAFEVVDWFAQEAGRVYTMLRMPQQHIDTKRLVGFIERHNGVMTTRQLMQSFNSRYSERSKAEGALQALVDDLKGKWEDVPPGPKGGRPSKRFILYAPTKPHPQNTPAGEVS